MLEAGKRDLPDDEQMAALAAKIGIIGGLGGAGAAGAAGGGGIGAKAIAGGATKVALAVKIGGAIAVVSAVGTGTAVVATKVRDAEPAETAPVGLVATATKTGTKLVPSAAPLAKVEEPVPSATPSTRPQPKAHATTSASASAEGPEAEVKLLERAQDALRARPAEALAICDDHARRFPRGMLAQEREVIAIEALVKAGRPSDAKTRAERFKKAFPGSSHTRRIDTLTGP
jgi:hypothetical protein